MMNVSPGRTEDVFHSTVVPVSRQTAARQGITAAKNSVGIRTSLKSLVLLILDACSRGLVHCPDIPGIEIITNPGLPAMLSSMKTDFGFSRQELAILGKLSRPEKVQQFLDEQVSYNKEPDGPTCRSPRRVLRDRVAHCIEGALLAAAAFRLQGVPPVIVDLEAVRDDDHLLAIFRNGRFWGAVGKSNYAGLRFREPVFRSLRELVMSYYPFYFNLDREFSLRTYSRPVDLRRFDKDRWMTAEEELWVISDYLYAIPHLRILTPAQARKKRWADRRLFEAGLIGMI
jgi:hypothetical protein